MREHNSSGSLSLTPQSVSNHNNNLDFLRLSLAVAVIFSHSFALIHGNNDFEPLDRVSRHGSDIGKLAVMGFFTISGLLITQSWMRTNSLRRFLEKRAFRIFPGYLAAVLICIFLFTPAVGLLSQSWKELAFEGLEFEPLGAKSLLLNSPFPKYINGSIWTIRYEFYCYLMVAALGMAGVLARPKAAIAFLSASLLLVINGSPIQGH